MRPLLLLTAASAKAAANPLRNLQQNPRDHYCGLTWPDAFETCSLPCPGETDDECSSLGEGYGCFGYTGCRDKVGAENSPIGNDGEAQEDTVEGVQLGADGQNIVDANKYCGATWLDAMANCRTKCDSSADCPSGESCQLATNCHVPRLTLKASMIVTMQGPDRTMENSDTDIFSGTMNDIVGEAAAENGIKLGGVNVGDQQLVDRRTLLGKWGERYLNARVYNVTQRFLPSGSSALDVSMVVTGDYRPPPYLDLDVITEDSINRGGDRVVSTLKERGSRAGSAFFDRVSGVEAVARAAVTQRPTRAPTEKPTPGPTGPPTATPSMEPSSAPSDMPSMEPTRTVYETIMTGSQQDLVLGGSTTSSYGYLFNMRSKPDAGVTLITGIDFYTHSTEDVTIYLYSRLGNFQDYKGSLDGWELIAEGNVRGRGVGRYTSIPEEIFTPVDIPGRGNVRAFYLTMSSINLVYQTAEGTASDSEVQVETPDVEVWEGEGVLARYLPDPSDPNAKIFFRFPRRFLGAIHYDRLPCKPFSAYGRIDELPCPNLPTQSPTEPQPSMSPVTSPPTRRPVSQAPVTPAPYWGTPAPLSPTETPTFSPTISRSPSFPPSTSYPTGSPIVPMRVNLAVNLRGVPERPMSDREHDKFLELMTAFLNKYLEENMIIEGIDIWHQQLVFVDAAPNSTDVTETSVSPNKKTRELLEQEKKDQIIAFKKQQKENEVPQSSAMQVTLIVKVSFSFLPEDLLAKLAVVTIEEHELDLMMMLQEHSNFYTYFKPLNGITSDVVLELTAPPTPEPTTLAFYLANNQEDVPEEDGGFGFGAFVGLGIGFLWCCLTGCSIIYVMKARTSMREQRDLEDLLKQEKSTPLDSSEASSGTDKSSIPMGHDDDASISTEAELSILERQKTKLAESKQNSPKLEAVDEAVVVGPTDTLGTSFTSFGQKSSLKKSADSLRDSSKANHSNSLKKSVRRGGSSDTLKGSSNAKLSNSMKMSIRQAGSSNSLRDSAKAKLSNSMTKSRRGGLSDSLRKSHHNDRKAPAQRTAHSRSELRKK